VLLTPSGPPRTQAGQCQHVSNPNCVYKVNDMSLNKLLIATALMVSFSGVALADEMAPMAASGATAPAKKMHKHHHKAAKKADSMAAPTAAS